MLDTLAGSDWPALAVVAAVIGYMTAVTWKALSLLSKERERKNDDRDAS